MGGINDYHVFGISCWKDEDGFKLCEDIKRVYEMAVDNERYWDHVALGYCRSNYRVEVRNCIFDDIVEMDTFSNLKNRPNLLLSSKQ